MKYTVKNISIRYNGATYAIGSEIDLEAKDAKKLEAYLDKKAPASASSEPENEDTKKTKSTGGKK